MQDWEQIGETEIIHDGWRKVFRKTMRMNNGREFVAEVSDKEGFRATAVVALTPDRQVIIARQFRVGPNQVMEELPGGGVDENEQPGDAAARELLEETGYRVGKLTSLGQVFKHAWIQTTWHYFLAEDCMLDANGQQLEADEEVEVALISIDQLIANAKNGLMTDTEAVFLAYEYLRGSKL